MRIKEPSYRDIEKAQQVVAYYCAIDLQRHGENKDVMAMGRTVVRLDAIVSERKAQEKPRGVPFQRPLGVPALVVLAVLVMLAVMPDAALAQSGCVLGCPEPPVRTPPGWLVDLVGGIFMAALQIWVVVRYGQK